MPRNLDRRVELLTPIEDNACRLRLVRILETYFRDTAKARSLRPDGGYERIRPAGKEKPFSSQEFLYREACRTVRDFEQSQPTVFEPHRAPGSKLNQVG
jgi:polyphosphate kinase